MFQIFHNIIKFEFRSNSCKFRILTGYLIYSSRRLDSFMMHHVLGKKLADAITVALML